MVIDSKTKSLLKDQDKRWAWIKYQLALKGSSLQKIAKRNNVSPSAIRSAYRNPYPKSEKLIADELGLQVAELFPERYDEDGLPARPYPQRSVYCLGRKHITDAAERNVKAVGAN